MVVFNRGEERAVGFESRITRRDVDGGRSAGWTDARVSIAALVQVAGARSRGDEDSGSASVSAAITGASASAGSSV